MIKNITEELEELRQTEDSYTNAATLLRLSVRTMFEVIGQSGMTTLNLRHPDGAGISVDLNRMTVAAKTEGGEMHFYGIDGTVNPPSNGRWVVRTDSYQPTAPSTPRLSRVGRLRESFERFIEVIAHPDGSPTVQPPKPIVDRGYHERSYVGERQIMELFIWIAGAQLVEQQVEITKEAT